MTRTVHPIDRPRRFAAFLLTLLLLVVGAPQDGYGLRACVHHESAGATDGGHGAHGAHAPDAGAPEGAPCTCVGVCHTAADLPAAPRTRVSVLPLLERRPERGGWVEVERLPAPVPFALPYPTAPPAG